MGKDQIGMVLSLPVVSSGLNKVVIWQGAYMKQKSKESGFTLLELIIVITIIAIMTSLVTPMYMDYTESSTLRGEAQNIYSLLYNSKMRAVRERDNISVVFDTATTPQRIQVFSNGGLTLVSTFTFSSNITYGHGGATKDATKSAGTNFGDDVTFNTNTVTFNNQGTANAGYVYIENKNDQTYSIGVLTTGLIKIRHWNGEWE